MGEGWETRRRRGPGDDWILIELGARAAISLVEVDTNHFKGNYPDRFALSVIDAPSASITELIASDGWRPLIGETRLQAHHRHFFREQLAATGPASHARLQIFPDGGISRLRLWAPRLEETHA